MNSGSSPCAPRYFELTASAPAAPTLAARAEIAAAAGHARGARRVGAGELGDDLLDRAARRELDDDERHDMIPNSVGIISRMRRRI